MGVCFEPGSTLGRSDLNIFLTNASGNPANAHTVSFALYWVDPNTDAEVLIGDPERTPQNPAVGEYYAPIVVPNNASPGDYRIRWTFQQFAGSPSQQVVQEFGVVQAGSVGSNVSKSGYSQCVTDMIAKLRILLRDNNPDRNYRFRPPEHEGTIGCYNQVFGYIWTDEELKCYLEIALDAWNSFPPETESLCTLDQLCRDKPAWRTFVLWGAMAQALAALSINWIADEFDYSIGGISLSIEKSSKYESMKANSEQKFDKAAETKARTTKYLIGLRQPRFGVGVRSAFGPHVGRGVLSPRRFV